MITDVAQACGYIPMSNMPLKKGITEFIKTSYNFFNNSAGISSIPTALPALIVMVHSFRTGS